MRRILGIEFFRVNDMIEDMLRYDTAFASDKFANIVAYPRFKRATRTGGTLGGAWGGKPTVDRWRSFLAGFNPIPMTPDEIRDAGILSMLETMCADGWYTIDKDDGSRIPLEEYLKK